MATYTASAEPAIIPNNYIVVFKANTPHDKCDAHCTWASEMHGQKFYSAEEGDHYQGIKCQYRLPNGWTGYSGSFDDDLIKQIEATDEVDYVEPDTMVYASTIITDVAGSWGQARISHPSKLTEDTKTKYSHDDSAGEGTRVYIIDTGILTEHDEFGKRAIFGFNAAVGSTNTDKNGHGTHCAGTIGGKTYGVVKKATLIGVKVLGDNGSGTTAGVIAGLQWALLDAQLNGVNKSVASMSLGGTKSVAMNGAVKAAVDSGLTVVVAAGNDSNDASGYSPASEPTAITVGATTIDDTMAHFSNWGNLVDVFAPGYQITSAWIDEEGKGSTSKNRTISGTSMACPHVAGLAAYLIALEGLEGPMQVTNRIKGLAGQGQLTGVKGKDTPNLLAFNGVDKAAGGNPPEEPPAGLRN